MQFRLLVTSATSLAVAGALALLAGEAVSEGDDAFGRDVEPFLRQWCFQCHTGEKNESGLDLGKLAASAPDADVSDAWRDVKRQLRRAQMPPKKAPQPPAADVAKVIAWIDGRAAASSDAPAVDPGRTTLRRLSRFEYRRTVRDLLGVDFDAESRLPADDVDLGFDNIGDVMTLSPALFEKFLAAAEDVASRTIVDEDYAHPPARRLSPTGAGWIEFYANGSTGTSLVLPREGEYVVRARAYGQQAGPAPVRMALRAEGASDRVADVLVGADAPAVYEARFRLGAGKRKFAVAFVNHYAKLDEPDPKRRESKLFVEWIDVVGPVDPPPVPESQRRLFGDDAGRPRDRAFAKEIVKRIADRAFRRPATDEEIGRLADMVELATKSGASFERGVQLALTAVLVSPHFLFRVEADPSPAGPAKIRDLTDFELATRLSYFLWSTMPDDGLFALAGKGALRDPETLLAQTKRMLADPRASALATNFAAQWLELRRLDGVAPDPVRFPQFDETLRSSMRRETEAYVEAIIRENRPLRAFLDADFTFVDERLAAHYGFDGVKGPELRRVKLPPGPRRGLLTQASILTLTSNPTRTSPVKRGKFILEEIVGEPPPPPPPGVGSFDESEAAAKAATLRQRLARHRSDPKCANCHVRMDALGFALENFDAVGAWRDRDGTQPVDAGGTLSDGREVAGAVQLRAVLLEDDAFVRCLAEKLLVYALGRAPTPDDRRALDRLMRSIPGLDATFADVVAGIVKMDGFRRRRGEGN